jgi:hypothetical protein
MFWGMDPNSGLTSGFSIFDNGPPRDALGVREFLAKKSITKMDTPSYSPDLAPCDFGLFQKLINVL